MLVNIHPGSPGLSEAMIKMSSTNDSGQLDTAVRFMVRIAAVDDDVVEVYLRPDAPYSGDTFRCHRGTWTRQYGEEWSRDIDFLTMLVLMRLDLTQGEYDITLQLKEVNANDTTAE